MSQSNAKTLNTFWGFCLALLIGGIGGTVFSYLQIPLAWMLGAMTACTAASIAGVPVVGISGFRPIMMAVIGVLLGSGFSPDLLGSVLSWFPSLLGLVLYIIVSVAVGTLYFRRLAKFDLATAYFAAMPGGLIDMMALGSEKGGDERLIALVHSARILLVVASLPYGLILLFDIDLSGFGAVSRPSVIDTPLTSELWLVVCAALGMFLGKLLRLPAKFLIGPMLLSGVVHLLDVSDFQPAAEIIIVAQLFLGTLIGCRFSGVSPKAVLKVLALSIGSVSILLAIAVFAVTLLSLLTGQRTDALLLAYSPGGLPEMSLIALSLGIEVAFVTTHHIARVALIAVTAALFFPYMQRLKL